MTDATTSAPRLAWGELLFALALVALGAITVTGARGINVPVFGADIGPRVFPYVVGTLLTILGALLCVQVLRGHVGQAADEEDIDTDRSTDWRTVFLLIAAIVAHVFLIVPAGWPIAAAVLFSTSAWVLGARPWWRAILIGVLLALTIQFAFAGLLDVSLPPGPGLDRLGIFGG